MGVFYMDDEMSLHERIKVLAIFSSNLHNCTIVKFKRSSGREVLVSEVGLVHPALRGKRSIHIFDVTDGSADYRLEFDTKRLVWHLVREADHYAR